MNIYLDEIDRASWNHNETSMSLASYLIRHPEIISKTAKFQEMEFTITTMQKPGGQRRIDVIFEDEKNIYFVECENKKNKHNEPEAIEGIKIRLDEFKDYFLKNYYKGDKEIQGIMAIINKKRW